jgi:hypothetical protein
VEGQQSDTERRRRSLLLSPKTKYRNFVLGVRYIKARYKRSRLVAGAYTDAEWRAIEESLKKVGIDIDALSVGEPFYPREQWWRVDHPETVRMRPLRDALQEMSFYYSVLDAVGPGLRRQAVRSAGKGVEAP